MRLCLQTQLCGLCLQIPNQRYDEEMAEYTAWQAAEKERVAAAKKLPKTPRARKGSKQPTLLPPAKEGPATGPEDPQFASAADLSPKPSRPRKSMEIMLHGIWGPGVPGPLIPDELTPATNAAQVTSRVLR